MDQPAFDRRHAEAPARFTSGGIAYREIGEGPPLVLLHGGAGDWRHWVMNVDALATRFRVLAFDLPNYGDSAAFGWEIETDVYLDLLERAVTEAVDGAERVHMAGFSFGGFLAANMAVRLGPRAAALSMTGGAGYGPPEGRPFTLDSRKRMAARLGREPTGDEIRRMQAENLAKLMIRDRDRIDDWAVDMQVSNVARTRFDSRRLSWADGTPELIGQLTCPVMIVYGEHDAAAIPPIAERIARCRAARPDARTHVIPECGHWAMYEAPETVNRLMLEFHGGRRMIRALAVWVLSAGLAIAQVPKPDEAALANARFMLWHQVTVALADQHGRRPDPWTAAVYALYRVGEGESAVDIERLLPVAETWLVAERDGVLPRVLSEAGIGAELARRVLCYVAAEGPGRAHDLVARWGAPRGSIDCAGAMAADFDAADRTFRAYPSGEGQTIRTRYGDDRWSRLATDAEVLEAMADTLSADFDWPAGLSLEIRSCEGRDGAEAEARYRPAEATITLCARMIGLFHDLADARIGN